MNILHKFRDHQVLPDAEILILGTFHPDVNTGPDFHKLDERVTYIHNCRLEWLHEELDIFYSAF